MSLKNTDQLKERLLALLQEITSGIFNYIALACIGEGARLSVICAETSPCKFLVSTLSLSSICWGDVAKLLLQESCYSSVQKSAV